MKQLGRFWTNLAASGCAVALAYAASANTGSATVQAIPSGNAQFAASSAEWQPLQVGTVLEQGSTIKTDANGVVQLYLGQNGPLLRIAPSSTVELALLKQVAGAGEAITTTRIKVTKGNVGGVVKKMSSASQYVVQTANGSFSVNGSKYAASATGRFTLQEGEATVVYTAPGSKKSVTYAMTAGQTFDPAADRGNGAVLMTSADIASEVALYMDTSVINEYNPVAKHWVSSPSWLAIPRPFNYSEADSQDADPWVIPPIDEPTTTPVFP